MKKSIWVLIGAGAIAGLFAALIATAQTPRSVYAPPAAPSINESWWLRLKAWIIYEEQFGRTQSPRYLGTTVAAEGRIFLAVVNAEGGTLSLGDVAVWDTTRIAVADTAAGEPARIENDLTAEGGKCWLYVFAASGTASDDSLWIYGKDGAGAAQTEIRAIADGDDQVLTPSAYFWTDIDSIKDLQSASGWTTYAVVAVPFCAVRASDGATGQFAGVVAGSVDATGAWAESIPDASVGFICVQGIIPARVNGASAYIWAGDELYPAASGRFAPVAAPAVTSGDVEFPLDSTTVAIPQASVARALQLATTNAALIRVWVK